MSVRPCLERRRARTCDGGVDVLPGDVSGRVAVWFERIVFRMVRREEKR